MVVVLSLPKRGNQVRYLYVTKNKLWSEEIE